MHLTDLPEEILIMIIRELDLQTLGCIYNTCRKMRNIVCMHGVIKQWHMSLNTMATAHSLKLNFFKDISGHLQELNLCAVPDLFKTGILPVMRRLKNLKILDISYTNLTILDFLEIYAICPTIKNISINFSFGKPGFVKMAQKTLRQCQAVFEHLQNVHFVGSINNLLYSKLALYMLEKGKLNSLKYTIAECDYFSTTDIVIENVQFPEFVTFTVYLLNWKETNVYNGCLSKLPVLAMLQLQKYEFIIIIMLNLNSYTIYVSPKFRNFFSEHFNVDAECITDLKKALVGNVAVFFWNKETTNFDINFFQTLKNRIKIYFPTMFNSSSEMTAPKRFDWFYTTPEAPDVISNEDSNKYEPEIRKRRIVAPKLVLNYDAIFKEKHRFQLSLDFNTHITNAITLTTNCDYLRKLTFLSLTGSVRYSSEFFNILFRCCDNLETLNVHSPSISPCASSISRSIPLSRSLKNIRLVDKRIDFRTLFSSFSQCGSLENIHILEDGESEPSDLGDPSIVLEKCDNLYSLYIEAPMSDTSRVKKLQLLNKAKARCQKYNIQIVLYAKSINSRYRYNYDPFVDVFNLNPIKPV